jgi:SH3-like domain-containing protein
MLQQVRKSVSRVVLLFTLASIGAPAMAADDVPYWASIRASEVNMRVGPGEDYRIKWTYRRQSLPMKVVRIKEGWRLVEDPDGAQGWMLARFLSRERAAYVRGKGLADMRARRLQGRMVPDRRARPQGLRPAGPAMGGGRALNPNRAELMKHILSAPYI